MADGYGYGEGGVVMWSGVVRGEGIGQWALGIGES